MHLAMFFKGSVTSTQDVSPRCAHISAGLCASAFECSLLGNPNIITTHLTYTRAIRWVLKQFRGIAKGAFLVSLACNVNTLHTLEPGNTYIMPSCHSILTFLSPSIYTTIPPQWTLSWVSTVLWVCELGVLGVVKIAFGATRCQITLLCLCATCTTANSKVLQ